MYRVMQYRPPVADDLVRVKDQLAVGSRVLASLVGIEQGKIRRYLGGPEAKQLSLANHFMLAAQSVLDDDQLALVFQAMRDHGAELDLAAVPAQAHAD